MFSSSPMMYTINVASDKVYVRMGQEKESVEKKERKGNMFET